MEHWRELGKYGSLNAKVSEFCPQPIFHLVVGFHGYAEAYLEPSRTSTVELFCENS